VLTAAISPYAAIRHEVRAAAAQEGIPFIEVFVQTELAVLMERDVKGLYKQALAGALPHFTGVSDPYEPPTHPDVTVHSDQETVEESAARILAAVWARLGTREMGYDHRGGSLWPRSMAAATLGPSIFPTPRRDGVRGAGDIATASTIAANIEPCRGVTV
jgi:hypothetical protein